MACGCSKRARAAARGQQIAGYRVTAPNGDVIPPPPNAPFFSTAEARAEVRAQGGGTVNTEYRQAS
jgi:hypothetical protein